MIIVSNFRDYYDSCVAYGIDKAIVYKREQEYISDPRSSVPGRSHNDNLCLDVLKAIDQVKENLVTLGNEKYSRIFVGFCGKLYCGLREHDYENNTSKFFWGPGDFTEEELREPLNANRVLIPSLHKAYAKSLADWYERNGEWLVYDCKDLFIKYDLVSFGLQVKFFHNGMLGEQYLMLNPALKDFGFQKAKSGLQAFQDIAMHISGVLRPVEKEPEPISDVLKAHSKGFDKHSFRKGPTKAVRG